MKRTWGRRNFWQNQVPVKSLLESLLDSYSKNFVQHEIDSSPTGRFHVERMFDSNGEFRPEFSFKTVEYWKLSERFQWNWKCWWWWCSTEDDIKIYGEVSFTHKVTSGTPTRPSSNIVVRGRVDHAIASARCDFLSMKCFVAASAMLWINSLFTWHVCVSLELSRLDASVYGLASDLR